MLKEAWVELALVALGNATLGEIPSSRNVLGEVEAVRLEAGSIGAGSTVVHHPTPRRFTVRPHDRGGHAPAAVDPAGHGGLEVRDEVEAVAENRLGTAIGALLRMTELTHLLASAADRHAGRWIRSAAFDQVTMPPTACDGFRFETPASRVRMGNGSGAVRCSGEDRRLKFSSLATRRARGWSTGIVAAARQVGAEA